MNNGVLDFLLEEREAGRIRNLGFSYHGDIKVFDYLLSIHDRVNGISCRIQLNYVDWKHAEGGEYPEYGCRVPSGNCRS